MGPWADISITRRDKGQIMERKNPQGFQGLEREDKELRSNAIKTRKLQQRNAKKKGNTIKVTVSENSFHTDQAQAMFVQACKHGLAVAKMRDESLDSDFFLPPNESSKPPGQM